MDCGRRLPVDLIGKGKAFGRWLGLAGDGVKLDQSMSDLSMAPAIPAGDGSLSHLDPIDGGINTSRIKCLFF